MAYSLYINSSWSVECGSATEAVHYARIAAKVRGNDNVRIGIDSDPDNVRYSIDEFIDYIERTSAIRLRD